MGLRSTRKIITALLTALVIFSLEATVIFCIGTTVVGNKKLYVNAIAVQSLADECEKQLDAKYSVLAHQTGLPKDAFTNIMNKNSTLSSLAQAAEYLFDENDAELKSDAREQYFFENCKEYLDANGIKYDEASVRNAASRASDVYSDTVGVHNLEFVKNYVAKSRELSAKAMSFFAVFTAVGIGAICLMYKKKAARLLYTAYAVTGAGISTVVTFVLSAIFREHKSLGIYYGVFLNMQKTQLAFLLGGGILLLAVGVALLVASDRVAKIEENRKNTRFSKIVDKL